MTCPRRKTCTALLTTLALTLAVPLAMAAPDGPRPQHGPAITPRTVDFRVLPRRVGPYNGPRLVREEAHHAVIDSIVEELKEHPRPPSITELGGVTMDIGGGEQQPLAPTAGTGFEGISQGPYIPSEPTSAAGPLNIFTAGNVSVTVTDKDGSNRVETDGQVFFGVPGAEGAISDAQCFYDALRGRFVALAFTQGTSPTHYSNFYLAISKTNDARGAWWLYKFDMTLDGTTPTSNWSDYESIGLSDDKLAMTGQQFTFSGNQYQYQKIRIIDRAAAYSGATLTYADLTFSLPVAQQATIFVTKAARNLSPGDNTIHCLCVHAGGGTSVHYRTVTGSPGSPVLGTNNAVTVASYSPPPDAVQKGTATLVATNDCRPGDFVVRDGVLVCAWHTSANISGTVSALRLFRMRTSDRVVLTDETYGAAATFYYYPAVTVDSVGTIFLGFDRSSSTEYPSAYATGKRRSDGTLQPSTLLKAGLSQTNQSRWGDYTGIDNDASLAGPGGSSAWYAGQWTKGTNTFGTWINKLTYTYGQVAGTVLDDCDGSTGTTGDRTALAGVSIALKQGVTTLATTTTDGAGAYSFGYLESGTYDVVVTAPAGGSTLDAIPGSGATSQTRVNAVDIQIALTNSQTSVSNQFLVGTNHAAPTTLNISPATKTAGDPAFTLTVNGTNFLPCAVVRLDGSNRTTTFVNAAQLTAAILAPDVASGGTHTITVFNPAPGGGVSNGQTLTVNGSSDVTPPTVAVTSPAGGESWTVGSVHNITWTANDDVSVAGIDIAFSTDGGATFPNVLATGIANSGSFAWTLPLARSTTARVRVIAHDGGGNVGSDSSHTNFSIDGWTITASVGANGTIAPNGVTGVADGATPSYTITPAAGYSIADVLVNGGSVGTPAIYNFPPVHADQTIAASFVINSYTLTVATSGSGSVTKAPDQPTYTHGSSVQLTATPAAGWNFQGWSGDATGSANPLSVLMDGNKSITATFALNLYTWNQTGSAAWGTASNWTPPRNTPSTDDVLQFNGGGSVTSTGVPTQTIGQLLIANNTTVALQSAAAATLTIAGGAGTDLDLPAGSALTLNGANALSIALGAPATAAVGGSVAVSGAAHRLVALGTNAVVFQGGSSVATGTGFTGSLFGAGTGTSALNSIEFENGSLYVQGSGANPFGASAPNSVVTFDAGSRFRLDASLTPSMSGRTYADFEMNAASSVSPTGGTAVTLDSLIVTQGTFNLNMTGGASIRGNIEVRSGATLTFSPASGSPVFSLAGTAPQAVNVLGTFSNTSNAAVGINNSSDVALLSNLTLAGPLAFTAGHVTTAGNVLIIGATGSVTGASSSAGYVVGNLRRSFAAGASSRAFDIGDPGAYTPVTVDMSGAAAPFDVTAATHTPDHPSLASSPLAGDHSANRWWTLTPGGSPSFTSYDATFTFDPGDLDVLAVPANFVVGRFSGSWSTPAVGARTATSTQATGMTGFSDFVVAEPIQLTLTIAIVGNGTVGKSPDQPSYAYGTPVTLTATPAAGWAFTAWSGDTTETANPITLTLYASKSVTATFADTTPPVVAVTAPNGGESFTIGSATDLTWTASDNLAVTVVDLLLSRNGLAGPFDPIVTGIANSGTYNWAVDGPATTTALLEVIAHDAAGHATADTSDATFTITNSVGVDDAIVVDFALEPVRPNPMRYGGHIGFALPRAAAVHLSLIDLQGREVMVLADGEFGAGRHQADIRTTRAAGPLEAGLYFARLQAGGRMFVSRFVLIR